MSKTRRPISLSLRFSVYDRDGHTCQYCGRKPPEVTLQVDHVYPVVLGGKNKIDNLLTACRDCNIGKGARDPGLAMPSRLLTRGESAASRQWWARWWAQDAQWARDEQIRSLAWEIAAKSDQDPTIIRRSTTADALLPGLAAIGVLTVRFQSPAWWSVSIDKFRGRARDEVAEADGWPIPWGLSAISDVRHAPNVREVY